MDMEKLVSRIQKKEGFRQFGYDDANGKTLRQGVMLRGRLSIGYGRNLTAKGISDDEARYLQRNDIQEAHDACSREPWWPMVANDDVRSRALTEIVFNLGIGGLHGFHRMLAALGVGDFITAALEYLDSDVREEIGIRAEELAYMLREGKDIEFPQA